MRSWLVLLLTVVGSQARADEPFEYRPVGTLDVVCVLEITAANGAVANVTAAGPVLAEWPSQQVELVDSAAPAGVRVVERSEPGVAKWMEVAVPRIPAGGRVTVTRTYRIVRSVVESKLPIEELETVAKPGRELRRHLATAPGIEPRDRRVRQLSESLVEEGDTAGRKATRFAAWIRENVKYVYDPTYRGTKACLAKKTGDCDDMTAVFVSLCRAADIPARTVWIEDHAYAEFLLVDGEGKPHWVPVDLASRSPLGTVKQANPILQKADAFTDPFTRRRVHYVPQGVRAVGAPVTLRSERVIVAAKPAE